MDFVTAPPDFTASAATFGSGILLLEIAGDHIAGLEHREQLLDGDGKVLLPGLVVALGVIVERQVVASEVVVAAQPLAVERRFVDPVFTGVEEFRHLPEAQARVE